MDAFGLAMFPALALIMVLTGLPAWACLVGTALAFSLVGLAAHAFPAALLEVLPLRIIGLLESDILQALPLYVLMGVLLNRLPLAETLFRTGCATLARTGAGPQITGLGLGVLLAPMNGSVGASITMLSRTLLPRLAARGVPPEQGAALAAVASTLGVVIPPSLVLILLGDTLLRAHTEAVNATHTAVRIINTQDIFRGALMPAALLMLLHVFVAWWIGRRGNRGDPSPGVSPGDRWLALVTTVFIGGLLAAVVVGWIYAVEAAASGGVALFLYGLASGRLRGPLLANILAETMAVTGALFALLVGATTFTLVLRAFGTDRWIASALTGFAGSDGAVLAIVLGGLALCSFVLDAFEIIFVVLPVVMPPLLMRVADAPWVAVLTLLILQASFLVPPFGYGVLMLRTHMAEPVSSRKLMGALGPFLAAQVIILGAVLAWPDLVWRDPAVVTPRPAPVESAGDSLDSLLQQQEP